MARPGGSCGEGVVGGIWTWLDCTWLGTLCGRKGESSLGGPARRKPRMSLLPLPLLAACFPAPPPLPPPPLPAGPAPPPPPSLPLPWRPAGPKKLRMSAPPVAAEVLSEPIRNCCWLPEVPVTWLVTTTLCCTVRQMMSSTECGARQ